MYALFSLRSLLKISSRFMEGVQRLSSSLIFFLGQDNPLTAPSSAPIVALGSPFSWPYPRGRQR